MASRKPLVIVNGQIQQLQAGDTLDATVSEQEIINLTNENASPIVIGAPVYISANDTVDLAKADASGTTKAIGLVNQASISSSSTGSIKTSGVLTATTTQWDAVAGTTGGLVAGTTYYLSAETAGLITATAPTTVGQYVVVIGEAISSTELKLNIEKPILL